MQQVTAEPMARPAGSTQGFAERNRIDIDGWLALLRDMDLLDADPQDAGDTCSQYVLKASDNTFNERHAKLIFVWSQPSVVSTHCCAVLCSLLSPIFVGAIIP